MELDEARSHPWASDILNQAAEKDGAAPARKEERKTIQYSQLKLPGVPSLMFVFLVMKHFGRWGKEANKYLQELSQTASHGLGKNNCKEFHTLLTEPLFNNIVAVQH